MDNFIPQDSANQNPVAFISNGIIENIRFENANAFVTLSYSDCINCQRTEQTIVLVVGNQTVILDENGNRIPVRDLRAGMTVNATISSAMTRSIPPQSSAFMIRIVRRPISDTITIGRIVTVDRQNRSFTTIRDRNLSSVIQFNVPMNALIFDRMGREVNFSRLTPGLQVWIRHASFMTASIPPQTTAFEIRIL